MVNAVEQIQTLTTQLNRMMEARDAEKVLRERAEKERDDLKASLEAELHENLMLFDKLGLRTKEDFGNDTSTATLAKRIDALMKERDDAVNHLTDIATRALSTDFGKGWKSPEEFAAMKKKCAEMWKHWEIGRGRILANFAHAPCAIRVIEWLDQEMAKVLTDAQPHRIPPSPAGPGESTGPANC